MATRAENIRTRLDAIAEALAGLTPYAGDDKPNHTGENHVDWVGYRMSLLQEQEMLNRELSAIEGAYEVTSEMFA